MAMSAIYPITGINCIAMSSHSSTVGKIDLIEYHSNKRNGIVHSIREWVQHISQACLGPDDEGELVDDSMSEEL